jgi:putative aminopeptidase FrvX
MTDSFDLLERLCNLPGVAGFEGPVREAIAGILSVPCRYIHSPFSTCRLGDFDHTWRLLAAFCKTVPGV